MAPPSGLPAISPSRGEITRSTAFANCKQRKV
ncbi:MAG: propionyl-coenzyme A carboxylase alpha polypeptide, partial [Mesorhizobium sp.]